MKVDIIYRVCGKETDTRRELRPEWFSKQNCFRSALNIRNTMPDVFKLHILWDGPDTELLDYIYAGRPDSLTRCNIGSCASIDAQWELADRTAGDYIYFLEDDYLHRPSAAKVFCEGAKKFNLISLYDHPDRYTRDDDITKAHESVAVTESCHWRTAESTTSTFGCLRGLWSEIKPTAMKCSHYDREFFRNLIQVGIRLWTPLLGESTHCLTPYLSPVVYWKGVSLGVGI